MGPPKTSFRARRRNQKNSRLAGGRHKRPEERSSLFEQQPQISSALRLECIPRRVTLNDDAKHANVSRALVSIVMRDAPGASSATRERVLTAARELGYRPDVRAYPSPVITLA